MTEDEWVAKQLAKVKDEVGGWIGTPGAGELPQIEDLKKIFKSAENYLRARDAYAKDKTLPYVPTDLKLDAMAPYIRGEKPISGISPSRPVS